MWKYTCYIVWSPSDSHHYPGCHGCPHVSLRWVLVMRERQHWTCDWPTMVSSQTVACWLWGHQWFVSGGEGQIWVCMAHYVAVGVCVSEKYTFALFSHFLQTAHQPGPAAWNVLHLSKYLSCVKKTLSSKYTEYPALTFARCVYKAKYCSSTLTLLWPGSKATNAAHSLMTWIFYGTLICVP